MSIRGFLGLPEKPDEKPAPVAETDIVRGVIDALDHLEESEARYIASFGYILGRVAHADLKISPEESAAMERIIVEHSALPVAQALIVVQMAKTRAQLFGGTDNFLVTREFDRMATPEQKMALLDCLFAVAAAEGHISMAEDNEIRQISSEIHVEHRYFIAIRSKWREHLAVLKNLPAR